MEEQIAGVRRLRGQSRILRLGTDNYQEQLENYILLQKHLGMLANIEEPNSEIEKDRLAKATVIDLRLSNLAFIAENF